MMKFPKFNIQKTTAPNKNGAVLGVGSSSAYFWKNVEWLARDFGDEAYFFWLFQRLGNHQNVDHPEP
jgi:hypothetical protein